MSIGNRSGLCFSFWSTSVGIFKCVSCEPLNLALEGLNTFVHICKTDSNLSNPGFEDSVFFALLANDDANLSPIHQLIFKSKWLRALTYLVKSKISLLFHLIIADMLLRLKRHGKNAGLLFRKSYGSALVLPVLSKHWHPWFKHFSPPLLLGGEGVNIVINPTPHIHSWNMNCRTQSISFFYTSLLANIISALINFYHPTLPAV